MRILNKKQKKVLDKWFETIKHTDFRAAGDPVKNLLPWEIFEQLEQINDHETIYQNINRYIIDKIMEVNIKKSCL